MTKKKIITFTGSQYVRQADLDLIHEIISHLEKPDAFVTGGCKGVDTAVACLISEYFPDTKHVLVLPSNRNNVGVNVEEFATHVLEMPKNSSYRDRDQKMVDFGTRLIAFWTGKKIRSGTFMTMNMGQRKGILALEDIHMIGKEIGKKPEEFYDATLLRTSK